MYKIIIINIFFLFISVHGFTLTITPDYKSEFTDLEKSVIADAIKEWAILLPCNDKMEINIDFYCDDNLGNLGETSILSWSGKNTGEGRPTEAKIVIDNDAHKWTLDSKLTETDAAETLKHEIGHALGINIFSKDYMSSIVTKDGKIFYDLNGDKTFNNGDWRVFRVGDEDHAWSKTDLMYYTEDSSYPRDRYEPTLQHARILGKTFGYCVVPEPSSSIMFLSGLIFIALIFKRKRNITIP